MITIKVIGSPLYQWELGRKISISLPKDNSINRVEFSQDGYAETLLVKPYKEGGALVADIPNILLQKGGYMRVYLSYFDEKLRETTADRNFFVINRPKPSDYIYTETEVWSYEALEKRMEELENNLDEQVESSIEEYLKENPIGGGVEFETDNTLTLKDGILSVNTTNDMEQDNTLPITSAGVYATVGNIEALLKTI